MDPQNWPERAHDLVLAMAGALPDEFVAAARGWIAAGDGLALAQATAIAGAAYRFPMLPEDADLIAELFAAAGAEEPPWGWLDADDFDPVAPYAFRAVDPLDPGDPPSAVDLSGTVPADPFDAACVAALSGPVGVRGLWRSWRLPALGAPWPPPKRVYLAEVAPADRDRRHLVADGLGRALAAAGESYPQVEVWAEGDELTGYTDEARENASLLWAVEPPRPMRIAAVFPDEDGDVSAAVPGGRGQITDPAERERLDRYLASGRLLLVAETRLDDVIDAAAGAVVPLDVRTDGTWIWTDAVAYYLREHMLAPDPELLAHMRARDCRPPAVDTVAAFRALAALAVV